MNYLLKTSIANFSTSVSAAVKRKTLSLLHRVRSVSCGISIPLLRCKFCQPTALLSLLNISASSGSSRLNAAKRRYDDPASDAVSETDTRTSDSGLSSHSSLSATSDFSKRMASSISTKLKLSSAAYACGTPNGWCSSALVVSQAIKSRVNSIGKYFMALKLKGPTRGVRGTQIRPIIKIQCRTTLTGSALI